MTESENTSVPTERVTVAVAPGGVPISIPMPRSEYPNAFAQHLFGGLSNWYRANVHEMVPDVLKRHRIELEGKMALYQKHLLPLTEQDRMEIVEAIATIEARLDEVLPKVPAAIDEHDHNIGDRAKLNWPVHLQPSTLKVHLHFCELIDSWRINSRRRFGSFVGVNETAEHEGVSGFNFDSEADLADFLAHYQLNDFVVNRAKYEVPISYEETRTTHYLTLSNKFTAAEVNGFLDVYKSAVNGLAIIHDERRRATNVDGGRIGFLAVDHFNYRETVELDRITAARSILGAGLRARGE